MSKDILPGDILLHMGKSEISKVVAWVGNSKYSHVAILLDPCTLIETNPKEGVVKFKLNERLCQTNVYQWIDVYRFKSGMPPAWLNSLITVATNYLGKSYAVNEVVWLGLLFAFRNKWPKGLAARALVRLALDLALKSNTKGFTCSEFVYRCFAEAVTTPQNALRPQIVTPPHSNPEFPEVDWIKLWKEYYQAIKPSPYGLEAHEGTPPPEAKQQVSNEVLQAKAAALRAQLGMQADSLEAPAADGTVGMPPNPKAIEPEDLAASPSFSYQQRVLYPEPSSSGVSAS